MGICADLIVFVAPNQDKKSFPRLAHENFHKYLPKSLGGLIQIETVSKIDIASLFPDSESGYPIQVKNIRYGAGKNESTYTFSNDVEVKESEIPMIDQEVECIHYTKLMDFEGYPSFSCDIEHCTDRKISRGYYPGLFVGKEILKILNYDEVEIDRAYLKSLLDEYGDRIAINISC